MTTPPPIARTASTLSNTETDLFGDGEKTRTEQVNPSSQGALNVVDKPKHEWFSHAMQLHPEIFALYERCKPILSESQKTKIESTPEQSILADIVPQTELIDMIMEYMSHRNYHESLELLEQRTSRKYFPYESLSGKSTQLETLLKIGLLGSGGNIEDPVDGFESDIPQPFFVYSAANSNIFDGITPLSSDLTSMLTYPLQREVDLRSVHISVLLWSIIFRKSVSSADEVGKSLVSLPDDPEAVFFTTSAYSFGAQNVVEIHIKLAMALQGLETTENEHRKAKLFFLNHLKKVANEFFSLFNENQIAMLQKIADEISKSLSSTAPQLAKRRIQPQRGDHALSSTFTAIQKPAPKIPRNVFSPSLSWTDIDDEELARQFCLMDFEIYTQIKPSEWFVALSGTKNMKMMPSLHLLMKRQAAVTKWVSRECQTAPLTPNTAESRRILGGSGTWKPVDKFIKLLDYLMRFGNIGGAKSVYDGISAFCGPDPRTRDENRIIEEARKVFSRQSDPKAPYPHYSIAPEKVVSPSVPSAEMVLCAIEAIDFDNKDSESGSMNFHKRALQFDAIQKMTLASTKSSYNYEHILQISKLFENEVYGE